MVTSLKSQASPVVAPRDRQFWQLPAALLLAAFVASAPSVPIRAEQPTVEEPAVEYFPQPSENEQRLTEALQQRVTIEFAETPLSEVAAWFEGQLGRSVQLDTRSLEDAGVGSDTPVTRHAKDIALRTALELVLCDLDLAAIDRDGMLLIVTQDKAETELVTRIYPVPDLLAEVPVPATPARPEPNHLVPPPANPQGGGMFAVADDSPAAHPPRDNPPAPVAATAGMPATRTQPDFDALIEVIVVTVKPPSWEEVGGPGSVSPFAPAKSLVISQTRPVHDEVLELLRGLRAAKRQSDKK